MKDPFRHDSNPKPSSVPKSPARPQKSEAATEVKPVLTNRQKKASGSSRTRQRLVNKKPKR